MSGEIPLFEVNPAVDRKACAERFASDRRIQIRDILTEQTAREVQKVLARHTRWGVAWQAGQDGPHALDADALARMNQQQNAEIGRKLVEAMKRQDYAFVYSVYPILTAYQEKWNPGGPHDLLIEHINSEPFMDLIREVTGIPELRKADAQGTLYRPGHFLAHHTDSHVAEGWRIAYVLNMATEEWRPEWGGYLLFHDEDGDVVAGFKPRFNTLNMFAVPQNHSVAYVPPFAPVARYAITGWFRDR